MFADSVGVLEVENRHHVAVELLHRVAQHRIDNAHHQNGNTDTHEWVAHALVALHEVVEQDDEWNAQHEEQNQTDVHSLVLFVLVLPGQPAEDWREQQASTVHDEEDDEQTVGRLILGLSGQPHNEDNVLDVDEDSREIEFQVLKSDTFLRCFRG